MDKFHLDPGLHHTLTAIRESVRQLFEQLRLRDEDGDISGKDRLERVPALSKRNFGYLVGEDSDLTIKEAYRLVVFLEGEEKGGQLTPLAREALRSVPLDKKLAEFRASGLWQDAATRMRGALGAPRDDIHLATGPTQVEIKIPVPSTAVESMVKDRFDPEEAETESAPLADRWRRPIVGLLVGGSLAVAMVLTVLGKGLLEAGSSDGTDGPLEDINIQAPAVANNKMPVREPAPPLGRVEIELNEQNARAIWTTDVYSYVVSQRGPGGGQEDDRLRVGGWGDTYISLIRFELPRDRRPVRRAFLVLRVKPEGPTPTPSRRTPMIVRAVDGPWDWPTGDRLWWRFRPSGEETARVPEPTTEPFYQIEITNLYNQWLRGRPNDGILLEPELTNNNFNTFYSTRAPSPEDRPRLLLIY